MKMSQLSLDALMELPYEKMWDIMCSNLEDSGESAKVALLLGTMPERALERALAAANLYKTGRVSTIIPSGGVKWEHDGKEFSEAEFMRIILIENGVPESAIALENEATNTSTNMQYGYALIKKLFGQDIDRIMIVTSALHMKRSLALARKNLPEDISISYYHSYPPVSKEEWLKDDEHKNHLRASLRLLKKVTDTGVADDMELPL